MSKKHCCRVQYSEEFTSLKNNKSDSHNHNSHNHNSHNHNSHNHNNGNYDGGSFVSRISLKELSPKLWILIVGLIIFTIDITLFILGITNVIPDDAHLIIGWTEFLMATFVFWIIGQMYFRSTFNSLIRKEINEDVLISISTIITYSYSLAVLIAQTAGGSVAQELPLFFGIALDVQVLIYVGRYLEENLTQKTETELDLFKSLIPNKAIIIDENNNEIEVDVKDLKIDDVVVVKNGQKFPLDGEIVFGNATVNEASFTGESVPVIKKVGDSVYGGSISEGSLEGGIVKLRITKSIDDSLVGQIIESIKRTTDAKPETQKIADKIAKYLVPSVLLISLISFFTISIFGLIAPPIIEGTNFANYPWVFGLVTMVTVMAIACPCSFSMTTPLSVLVASSRSAKHGINFSSTKIFEEIKKIDAIAFDKTGTLTEGIFTVVETNINKKYHNIIYQLEDVSIHPIAISLKKYFEPKNLNTLSKINAKEELGLGIYGEVDNVKYHIGSRRYLDEILGEDTQINSETITISKNQGKVIIYLFTSSKVIGYIILEDKIKESAVETIMELKNRNIDVYLITGDNKDVAFYVADKLGIDLDNIFWNVLPTQKPEKIKELQNEGKIVAFCGDGVNDSVALLQADLGIAMGSGADAAINSSDVVILKSNLMAIIDIIDVSKQTLKNIYRGFTVAITYNIIVIPLAAFGILTIIFGPMAPVIAALLMFFNDTLAVFNALVLKTFKFKS